MLHYTALLALQALGWAAMLHYTACWHYRPGLGMLHYTAMNPQVPQHISAVLKELFQPSLFQIDKEVRLDLEWGLSQHD
jgi:hypothetical protein